MSGMASTHVFTKVKKHGNKLKLKLICE